jgi:hypothetical protein
MMKKHSPLRFGTITLACLFALIVPAAASASCVAEPTPDMGVFRGALEPKDVPVFDFGFLDKSLEVLSESSFGDTFFTKPNDGKSIKSYADTVADGLSLLLGEDPGIGAFFTEEGHRYLEHLLSGIKDAYCLHDKEPTHAPLPGAALLFGTGLIGLVATRLKTRKNT